MRRWGVVTVALVLGLSSVHGYPAEENREPARQGFAVIRKATKDNDKRLLAQVFPQAIVKGKRGDFAKEIVRAKVLEVREHGARAVVRFTRKSGGAVREVLLRHTGNWWAIDCPQPYVVSGEPLTSACGKKPVKVSLSVRKAGRTWGGAAYSFGNVTKDAWLCKNKVDIWYCPENHVHPASGSMARAGSDLALDKVTGLEPHWRFGRSVIPRKGDTLVVHCLYPPLRSSYRRDFYVKLRILDLSPESLQFEWTILAHGPGAPKSIRVPVPVRNRDGRDGMPGMCGKGIIIRTPARGETTPATKSGKTAPAPKKHGAEDGKKADGKRDEKK